MSNQIELAALVALLRSEEYRRSHMALRQRLIEGELPTEILRDSRVTEGLIEESEADVCRWLAAGETPLTWLDPDYPRQLREVHDFPPVIFIRGQLKEDDRGICVVGSRDAGPNALRSAREIAGYIADESWSVVSGLAKGIDTAAHQEALRRSSRTVAVIGNGIDISYPRENSDLQANIEENGLVLSQFWPGSPPTKISFPMRNAVMSAYANATIIVTANEKSGTRHQARQAAAHGRPLVVSKLVYERTSWAKKLVDDPHVMADVAYSEKEAVGKALSMADLSSISALMW